MVFFLIVDLLVLIVTAGGYAVLHDKWVDCQIKFNQWSITILVFISFSLFLAIVQFYLRRRMKTYIDLAERAALKASVESLKDLDLGENKGSFVNSSSQDGQENYQSGADKLIIEECEPSKEQLIGYNYDQYRLKRKLDYI